MVQDQLVDYISSQMKLGVARGTIKAALLSAGWIEADVEDTFKKVEGSMKPAAAAAAPASMPGMTMASTKPATTSVSPAQLGKSSDPQTIRVSDLVSASGAASASSFFGNSGAKSQPSRMETMSASMPSGSKLGFLKSGGLITKIVGVVVIVLLAGLAGYLYWQNSSLAAQVTALNNMSSSITSQTASFNSQIAALNASNASLTAELASATGQNADISENLLFVLPASLASPSASGTTITLTGTLTQATAKNPYSLATPYGIVALIANGKSAKVAAALSALASSTAPVTLVGTHTPGSQYLNVTSVNGTSVE